MACSTNPGYVNQYDNRGYRAALISTQYAGAIIAAGTTLGTFSIPNDWSWRLPSLLQMAPAMLQLIFIWFIPESPRWLLSKDRDEEAFDILVKYHAEGDRNDPFVNAEYSEILDRVRHEIESSKRSWTELLRTPGNRRRTFIACSLGYVLTFTPRKSPYH